MIRVAWVVGLLTPHGTRWQPMLLGLAAFAAAAAGAVLLRLPQPVAMLLVFIGLCAWLVGACAMVGYIRWYIADEIRRATEERDGRK